jgi:hypothetical protein
MDAGSMSVAEYTRTRLNHRLRLNSICLEEAEEYLKKDQAYIERMIEYSKGRPRDLAFWESKVPRIEYVEDK